MVRIRFIVVAAMAALLLGHGVPALAQKQDGPKKGRITGSIVFEGPATLGANTIAKISLVDVSLQDAPSKLLSKQEIANLKMFPIPFEVEYDPALIKQGRSYAIQVRLETDGKLDYINDTRIAVINNNRFQDVKAPVIRVKR